MVRTLNAIWAQLISLKGAAFTRQFGDVTGVAFQEWLRHFYDLEPEHLQASFQAWRRQGEGFIDATVLRKLALQASGVRYPSAGVAYVEACEHAATPLSHSWSSPLVYFAGRDTGWFELRTEGQKKMLPLFREAYQALLVRAHGGETFEVPTRQSNVKTVVHKAASKAFARQQCQQIADDLNA